MSIQPTPNGQPTNAAVVDSKKPSPPSAMEGSMSRSRSHNNNNNNNNNITIAITTSTKKKRSKSQKGIPKSDLEFQKTGSISLSANGGGGATKGARCAVAVAAPAALPQPQPQPQTAPPELVAETFELGRLLGHGSYGEVRVGRDVHNQKEVAIKLEPIAKQLGQLAAENEIYALLKNQPGFPTIFFYGQYRDQYVLVMQMLDRNLEAVFDLCHGRFTLKSVLFLALQLLKRFQAIHQAGIVYRDVKPENFMMAKHSNTVYVIDFGLSQRYLDPVTRQHIPFRRTNELIGTTRYMSINAHQGKEQGRKDDLEALGYVFAYWLRGRLPWSGMNVKDAQLHNREICRLKSSIQPKQLLEHFPDAFAEYLQEVRAMDFADEPRYEQLRQRFKRCFYRHNLTDDGVYDWNVAKAKKMDKLKQTAGANGGALPTTSVSHTSPPPSQPPAISSVEVNNGASNPSPATDSNLQVKGNSNGAPQS